MAYNDNDLDLSQIKSTEHDELAARIESFFTQDSTQKIYLAYHWERNHLMLDGNQWITYVGGTGASTGGKQWDSVKVSQANEYIPRPVTNYLFDVYQTLKSYLLQQRPRSKVVPNTQSYKDKQAAKLSELLLECNWERLQEEKKYEYAAANLLTYGTVFKRDYWDTSSLQRVRVPMMRPQPITDPMTGAVMGYQEKEVTDPETGDLLYEDLPLGDLNSTIVEPWRMALDPIANDMYDMRWLMEYNIVPLDRVKEMFSRQEEGYTGEAANLQPESMLNTTLTRFLELKNSSGTRGDVFRNSQSSSGDMIENAVVIKDYYEAPSEQHPEGRRVVVANGKTLYSGPTPYDGPELGNWHPYSECRWELVPGRFWGKSPLDNATDPQKRINSIDSTITLTRKTMAIPQKLIPKGSGIAVGSWTGRPGQQIEYRDTGARPETVPSAGVDPQVWKEREQCVEDIKQITGAIDILKGDRPPGVTAASALEMLYEVGTGKLRPILDRWKMFVEGSQKKQLRVIANYYREPREEYINYLKSKNTELPETTIENFIGAELYDNCNVKVEAGSSIPKLESAQKARLMEAAQTGALQLEIPENRAQFLEDMGISGYDLDVSPDVKRAEWENSLMDEPLEQQDAQPVILADDNHQVHVEIHTRRMKAPSFMFLPQEVQQQYMQHIEEHGQYIQQQQQMAQIQAMQGQAPAQPQNPMQPGPDLEASGDGVPAKTANALAGIDLPPDAKI